MPPRNAEDSKAKGKSKFWLYAFRDHLANLQAYTNSIDIADINGDGDYKLLVADGSKKLKVYGGTSLQKEMQLLGVPSAITSFYMTTTGAFNRPIVAVAVGYYIFMYCNNNPLYRFTLPAVALDAEEVSVWDDLARGHIDCSTATQRLDARLREGVEMSGRTLEYLLIDAPKEKEDFVQSVRGKPLVQMDLVTCMSSINMDCDDSGLSCLTVGTENRLVYILKNNASQVELKIRMPSAPVHLIPSGCLHSEYRVIVSCRDGRIYSIKNGEMQPGVIQPDAQPSAIARYNNLIAVTTMANTLSYYNLKGKRQSSIHLPTAATNVASLTDPITGTSRGVIVALSNGEIRVYVGKTLQHVSQAYGSVTAMRYGRYSREDSALVLVLSNGSLVVELLHRSANLSVKSELTDGPPPEQEQPIPVPHLSSVFATQTEREKKYSIDMYRAFQYDLCHLGLYTAKSYLSMIGGTLSSGSIAAGTAAVSSPSITDSSGGDRGAVMISHGVPVQSASRRESTGSGSATGHHPSPTSVTHSANHKLRVIASVQGLGPVFKIKVLVQNLGNDPLRNLVLLFVYPPDTCTMQRCIIRLPYIVPTVTYPYEALVQLVEETEQCDGVYVVVMDGMNERPFAITLVDIPVAFGMEVM